MYRVQIGPWVRHRLQAVPGMLRLPSPDLEIFLLRDFLNARECAGLIARIDASKEPSTLLGDGADPEFRTSESCNLDPRDPLVIAIERKIGKVMAIDPRHGETIQGQRYAAGQQFKPHHDFFHRDQPYWADEERAGGQRTWTAMIFLGGPDAGGETYFPDANVKVSPRAGNLLAWNNLDAEGEPNPCSLHQGMPVEAGVKYIVTKWYRERPWAA